MGVSNTASAVVLCNDFQDGHYVSSVVNAFAAEFSAAGYFTSLCRNKDDLIAHIEQLRARYDIKLCFDINLRFSSVQLQGQPFYERYGFQYASTLDTPFNKVPLIQGLGEHAVVLAADPGLASAIHEVNPRPRVTDFGTEYFVEPPKAPDAMLPIAARPIDVLFCGNVRFFGNPARYSIAAPFFDALIAEGAFTNEESILDIASRLLAPHPALAAALTENKAQFFEDLWMAMHVIRTNRRLELLQQLQRLGLSKKVVVISDCQRHGIQVNNVTMVSPKPWPVVQQLFEKAKIIIHNIPMHTGALHERLMHTATAGAVMMTDSNTFFRSIFSHNQNVLFYSLQGKNLHAVAEKALQDEAALAQIAANGRSLVLDRCRLQAFVVKLLQYMQLPVYDSESQTCGEQSPHAMQQA
ncbi:glycosyltransferase [Megalodesulfovibrio paquesii]